MHPEARLFKTNAKFYIPKFKVQPNDKVICKIKAHNDWYYKNGKLKKADVQNLTKVIIDAISEKLGFDDSQVWRATTDKVQSEKKGVEVRLWTTN